mgnify:CR=1 FL=1
MAGLLDLPEAAVLKQLAPKRRLYARWPARKRATSWWKRLMGQGPQKDDPPLGELRLLEDGLAFRNSNGEQVSHIVWEAPFTVQLSAWPYDPSQQGNTAELNLLLRPRDMAAGGTPLALRTLWPTDSLPVGLSHKQEFFPFVDPVFFKALWSWLSVCLSVHGSALPRGGDMNVDDAILGDLHSHNEVFTCVSCQSQDVTLLAARVYRCNQCGYEGGPGMADLLKQRRRMAIERMPPDERRESALNDYREARRLLLSAQGTMKALYAYTYRGNRDEAELERSQEAMGIARMVIEALEHIEEAGIKDPERFQDAMEPLEKELTFARGGATFILASNYSDSVASGLKIIGETLIKATSEG